MMTTNSRKMRKFDEVVQESWVVYYGVKNIRERTRVVYHDEDSAAAFMKLCELNGKHVDVEYELVEVVVSRKWLTKG